MNQEQINAQQRASYSRNPTPRLERMRAYYQANRERINARVLANYYRKRASLGCVVSPMKGPRTSGRSVLAAVVSELLNRLSEAR